MLPTLVASDSLKCVIHAVMANLLLGAANYVVSSNTLQLGRELPEEESSNAEWRMVALVIGVSGLPGIFGVLYHCLTEGRFELFYPNKSTDGSNRYSAPITFSTKVLTIMGGLSVGMAMAMLKMAFEATPPENQGPVSAVVGTTVVVVSVYSNFVFKERVNNKQMVFIAVVLLGVMMSAFDAKGGDIGADADTPTNSSICGVVYAVFAMFCFAAQNLLVRHSSIGNVGICSGFCVRQFSIFIVAVVAFAAMLISGGDHVAPLPVAVVTKSVVAGVSQAIGLLFLNAALEYPFTNVVSVIVASNSIVVLGLNFFIGQLWPEMGQLTGMGVTLTGVVATTLLQTKNSLPMSLPVNTLHKKLLGEDEHVV